MVFAISACFATISLCSQLIWEKDRSEIVAGQAQAQMKGSLLVSLPAKGIVAARIKVGMLVGWPIREHRAQV